MLLKNALQDSTSLSCGFRQTTQGNKILVRHALRTWGAINLNNQGE
jgi:hypothetical protein